MKFQKHISNDAVSRMKPKSSKFKLRDFFSIKRNDEKKKRSSVELITNYLSKGQIWEAYRSLRTNVQFLSVNKSLKAFLVTSSVQREGKTTTLVNLGIAFAQTDKRVIIVDTDLRRPTFHKIFDIDNSQGLSDVLTGKIDFNSVIKSTGIPNLSIINGGPTLSNPSELISSPKMLELIEFLKQKFDIIFFDSPPILAVTDSSILSVQLDGVILVVQGGKIDRKAVWRAKTIIEDLKGKIVGVVLNDINLEKSKYYYYYYHQYYRDYLEEEETSEEYVETKERVKKIRIQEKEDLPGQEKKTEGYTEPKKETEKLPASEKIEYTGEDKKSEEHVETKEKLEKPLLELKKKEKPKIGKRDLFTVSQSKETDESKDIEKSSADRKGDSQIGKESLFNSGQIDVKETEEQPTDKKTDSKIGKGDLFTPESREKTSREEDRLNGQI